MLGARKNIHLRVHPYGTAIEHFGPMCPRKRERDLGGTDFTKA